MSLGQANVAAGYRNGNRKAAWITRQNPKIAARIVELTEEKLAAERLARERAQVKFDLSAERGPAAHENDQDRDRRNYPFFPFLARPSMLKFVQTGGLGAA
jgi:hypothetical protein